MPSPTDNIEPSRDGGADMEVLVHSEYLGRIV
jgi:hypothetical protein